MTIPAEAAMGWFQRGSVSPDRGNTSTNFSYNVQLKTDPLINVIWSVDVRIDEGTAQEKGSGMQRVQASDPEWYYVDNIKLTAGNHTYQFYAHLIDTDTSPQSHYYISSSSNTGPNVDVPPAPKAEYQVVITNNDDDRLTDVYFKTNADSSYQGPYSIDPDGGVFRSDYIEVTPGDYRVTIKWTDPDKGTEDSLTSSWQGVDADDEVDVFSFTIPRYVLTANHSPQLSNDYVNPTSGDTSTNFNFYVTYTDADGDAPTIAWVNIDGTGGSYSHTMTKISGSYTGGAIYKYTGSGFSVDTHGYNFYFSDGEDFDETSVKNFTVNEIVNTPPTVLILSGPQGSTTEDSATFTWFGSDTDGSVVGYYYDLDDTTPDIWTTGTTKTFTGLSAGEHTFYVKAKDNEGAYSSVASRTFTVVLDNDPPEISISVPSNGDTVSSTVPVLITAIDPEDGALDKIEYYVDDSLKYTDNSPDAMSPASSWNWDTTAYSNGGHTLKVIGYDSQGLTAEDQIDVTVNDPGPEVIMTLLTTEACGYLPLSLDSQLVDTIKLYIDGSLAETVAASGTSCQLVNLDVLSEADGAHTVKAEGWSGGVKKTTSQTLDFYVNNQVEFFLRKSGQKVGHNLIKKHEVENYKLVVRTPWPAMVRIQWGGIEYGGITFLPKQIIEEALQGVAGYEVELPLKIEDFYWTEVNGAPHDYQINVGRIDGPDTVCDSFRIRALNDADYTHLSEKADYFAKLFGAAVDVLKQQGHDGFKGDPIPIDVEGQQLTYQYVYQDGDYFVKLFTQDGDELIEFIQGAQDIRFRVTSGNTAYVYDALDVLQLSNQEGGFSSYVVGVDGSAKVYMPQDVELPPQRSDFSGYDSLDDLADMEEYFVESYSAKKTFVTEIHTGKSNVFSAKVRTGIASSAKFIDRIMFLGTVAETIDLASEGPYKYKEATQTITSALAGGAAGVATVGLLGVGLGPAVVGVGVVVVVGHVTYYIVGEVLPGPVDVELYKEVYSGESAILTFPVINTDKEEHTYELSVDCSGGSICSFEGSSSDDGPYVISAGDYQNVNVYVTPSFYFTRSVSAVITVVEDNDPERTWKVNGKVFVNPVIVYPPYCDPGECTPCMEVNGIVCDSWVDPATGLPNLKLTRENIAVNWSNLLYSIHERDFNSLDISKSEGNIQINVPDKGDTHVLANSPATITIEEFYSSICTIKHNDVIVYEDGEVLDDSLITDIFWDQINHTLTFKVSHWDSYTIIYNPSQQQPVYNPEIKFVKFNDKQIIAGDYVSSIPSIDIEFKAGTYDLANWKVEIFEVGGSAVVSYEAAVAVSSAGEVSASYTPDNPFSDGKYFARITIFDEKGNSSTYDSPLFEIKASFVLSALNGPNPFSPNGDGISDLTKIGYQLSTDAKIKIRIIALSGHVVAAYDYSPGITGKSSVGYNEVEWDGRDLNGNLVANGVYLGYFMAEANGVSQKVKLKIAVLK